MPNLSAYGITDLNSVKDTSFGLVPVGEFQAIVADIREVSDINGVYWNVAFEILDDGLKGRKIYQRYYVGHNDAEKRQKSLEMYKKAFKVLPLDEMQIMDSDNLENQIITIVVKHSQCGQYANLHYTKPAKGVSGGVNQPQAPTATNNIPMINPQVVPTNNQPGGDIPF